MLASPAVSAEQFMFGGKSARALEAGLPCMTCSLPTPPRLEPLREVAAAKMSCQIQRSKLTFYNPAPHTYRSRGEAQVEGGSKTRFQEPINSIEASIRNGRPVTLAADIYGSFGRDCNRRERRCTILVTIPGFDRLYPEYRRKFPHAPADSFFGIVEDTGGSFYGKGTSRLDMASLRASLARGATPRYLRENQTTWRKVESPCGMRSSARRCDLSNVRLSSSCRT